MVTRSEASASLFCGQPPVNLGSSRTQVPEVMSARTVIDLTSLPQPSSFEGARRGRVSEGPPVAEETGPAVARSAVVPPGVSASGAAPAALSDEVPAAADGVSDKAAEVIVVAAADAVGVGVG